MAKSKNDYTFDDIKAMLLKEKEKYDFQIRYNQATYYFLNYTFFIRKINF